MNAIELAIEALFADPHLSRDALWRAGGTGDGTAVRVIRKRPDQVVGFGDSRAVLTTVLIDVRQSEVPSPAEGDMVEIEAETFAIIATPIGDTERLIWTCEAAAKP
jgi:hypothetical protein